MEPLFRALRADAPERRRELHQKVQFIRSLIQPLPISADDDLCVCLVWVALHEARAFALRPAGIMAMLGDTYGMKVTPGAPDGKVTTREVDQAKWLDQILDAAVLALIGGKHVPVSLQRSVKLDMYEAVKTALDHAPFLDAPEKTEDDGDDGPPPILGTTVH
jgi:hypothetical protein